MPVTHFITHRISKEAQHPAATLTVCEQEPDLNDHSQSLMSQLRTIFVQRASKRYGRFNPEISTFKALTQDFLREGMSFTAWSKKICDMFIEKMDSTSLETEGYLAFITEQLVDGDRLYVFHVREKSSVALTENMELIRTRFIDFSNTGFALCLDTTAFLANSQEQYLTFSFGRGDKAFQNVFCEFSGFTDTVNTEQDTQEFLQIVDEYTQQMPSDEATEMRTNIVDYCVEQDKHGEVVEFKILSSQLNEQAPERFEQFVIEKRKERRMNSAIETPEQATAVGPLKTEFIPDRKSLKNYIRYSGKNKDVTLSFAATALGNDISFDETSDSLVIKNLPSRLLKQLKQNS